jgi:zinc protease
MEGLTREDAIAFYDRYYTPNNAILIVAGDVTEDEVRKLAEATYGKLPRRSEPPPRIRPSEPEAEAARVVTLTDPRVTQPSVQRQFVTPSYGTAKPGEAEAIDVLAQILGGGTTSRLYKALVLGKGIATSAGAGYGGTALGETGFGLYGTPRGGVTPEALIAEIQAVVGDVAENGVTDEELARAKRAMIASAVYSQDSHSELANVFGQALIAGQTVAAVQHWPEAIEAVTAAEVQAAARRYLTVPRSVTGYLMPASGGNRS